MNEFFGTAYSQADLLRRRHSHRGSQSQNNVQTQQSPTAGSPQQRNEEMIMTGMVGGDTLDDIIMQNNNQMQRRQSMTQHYNGQDVDRRQSMMEFGSNGSNMNAFQFGPTVPSQNSMLRRQSAGEVDIADGYPDMTAGMNMTGQTIGFSQAPQDNLTIDTTTPFSTMSGGMQGMIDYGMGMDGMTEDDSNGMNMFSPVNYSFPQTDMEQMSANYMMGSSMNVGNMGASTEQGNSLMGGVSNLAIPDNSIVDSPQSLSMNNGMSAFASPDVSNMPLSMDNQTNLPQAHQPISQPNNPEEVAALKMEPKPVSNYQGIYSSSGFDMLGALMKVATRKNPEIDIGKVDMSCAFVVCDITQTDCPIIYVSDIFERLTGYSKHEVLGQNCRFLQSPEGKVQGGARREFVDNDSVYYLKTRISQQREAQRSLINYRKGGQPFMNLLTMIPITGEDDKEIKYFVGFQVDLVEKPTSVEGKNASGLYTVDYSQGMLPRYVWQPPDGSRPQDGGQTISRDDVSAVLTSINTNTDSELTKRMWDKVLLENTDDVVHVLSLKGLFLYLSPSSRKVLEYDASELVGTALSSVCHPSDIVPVTRELKDTSTGAPVNVVFRIRRKKSGYTWFESHGSLCVEQGKGRKCIILVGRERPVYALSRNDIDAAGGIGEAELWSKVSTSGMFLFVSSNVRTLLDRSPDDLIGTSIQALMRTESRKEFGRSLEKARTGKRTTHKHELLNKRGVVLQAQTTLYPGDAAEGQKPTFLVAQTRMLKTSRTVAATHGSPGSVKSSGSTKASNLANSGSSAFSQAIAASPAASVPPDPTSLPAITRAGGAALVIGSQDQALASEDNIFDELKTTRCTSWQFELRQMEKSNRLLAEELANLISNKKKRKRRRPGHVQRDCANCHTRVTPEWRRGPSGQRDLCNSCGLRWAKQTGRVSPRTSTKGGADNSNKAASNSASPVHSSPLGKEFQTLHSSNPNLNTSEKNQGDIKGEKDGGVGGMAALPGSLGGRSTIESMPVHEKSTGYRGGGERGITNIAEGNEAAGGFG